MKNGSSSNDSLIADLDDRLSGGTARLETAVEAVAGVFAAVATKVTRSADQLADAISASEVHFAPLLNFKELIQRLDRDGPAGLSRRELRVLVGSAGQLDATQLARALDHAPALVFHAARTCFAHWPDYVREPWGSTYQTVVSARLDLSAAQLLRVRDLTARQALSRDVPGLETALARQLSASVIEQAYDQLKALGVRDSWLLSSSVLTAWLVNRLQRGLSLEEAAKSVLRHERLRALLLPAPKSSTGGPAVRTSVAAQAKTVATFLAAADSDPQLIAQKTLMALTDYLLRSTFDDPRMPLRSDGWNRVSQLYETGFRRMLSALCEQDLEVFFKHAMEQPDRHKFWLQYLHEIERTGCVLERGLRERLEVRLERRPELQGALERAFPFGAKSDAQAFFLVFRAIVVVEFSRVNHAAYVYPRAFFEKAIEPGIRARATAKASDLKGTGAHIHRIIHLPGWERDTAAWLASEGVHPRQRGR